MRFAPIFAFAVLWAPPAQAEPGGTSGVTSPVVTEGAPKLEFRTAAWDGGALGGDWAHRAQAGYSLTDWWRATVVLRASQPDGASAELRSIGLEQVFFLTASRGWPVQVGGQVEYKLGVNGAADEVDVKALFERRDGPSNLRLNLNGSRHVGAGAPDEWEHVYAARAMWRTNDRWSFGVEAFGEPEASAHYLGPRVSAALGAVTLSGAYLAGFYDARAEAQFRLTLEVTP